MLSAFDDYPIHQTPDPILTPASGDDDFYERYWFNGYHRDGDYFLAVGAAVYPHLGIQDCGVSLVIDGKQYAFHASARANAQREMTYGPFSLDIIEPMKSLRITVSADDAVNDTDMACDLLFEGRTGTIEEPRHHFGRGIKRVMDTTRFTQFGRWSGWIEYDGKRLEIDPADTWATKDRSWGVRPLAGGDKRAAPALPGARGGLFFLWAPLHFDDICTHYQLFDDHLGRPMFQVGAILPTYGTPGDIPGIEDPNVEPMRNNEHALLFEDGSRMIASGTTVAMTSIDGATRHEIEFEKILTFRMKGIGYSHPVWGHGAWKGESAMASESWSLADVDDNAFENQHVQHLMKVTMGDRVGIGVLEQVMLGPYQPYGLEGMF